MNDYPTQRQVEALRDVERHPGDTLRARAVRLGVSHPAVVALLRQCERRTLAIQIDGEWRVTRLGRAWLRPTMPTRTHARSA